jgi:hypothetical protein
VSSSQVILHWLRWSPGSGKDIQLGRDKLIGLDELSILSLQLRSLLLTHNITTLAQLKKENRVFPLPDHWLHSSDLALGGPAASELDTFTAALKCSGLSLTAERDTLTWTGGDGKGLVEAKNVYDALLLDRVIESQPLWHRGYGLGSYH